jgi:c(7)-type cytochrome triheme protein
MDAGKSCGLCHNGKDAFGTQVAEACESCHQEPKPAEVTPVKAVGISPENRPAANAAPASSGSLEGASPQSPAPRRPSPPEVKLAAGAGSPGPVTFRHSSHSKEKCGRCHPALFAMKASATPLDYEAMTKGSTCGACHDGKQAFGVEDSDSCEKCHAPAGGKP